MTSAIRRSGAIGHRGSRVLKGAACSILLVVAALTLASNAVATPTVTLKAEPLPIPGFAGTGNVLGAGVEVETQVTISGEEYGGSPSPLTGINIYAPAGLEMTSTGFATCARSVLEAIGPSGCPKRSSAGPQGVGNGVVSFGSERVPEEVSIQGFFAVGGGLTFFVKGSTPSLFEVLEPAHWVMTSAPPFGPELFVEVPLIETLPGADDASVTSFKVKVGAAYRKGKRTISYLTTPRRCPRGGFPTKMELKFLSGETVTAPATVPCPAR